MTNAGDYIYMVVNGACKHGDMAHFKEQMADFKGDVHMDYLETQQLLALQGKGAPAALQVGDYGGAVTILMCTYGVRCMYGTVVGRSPAVVVAQSKHPF